MDKETRDRMDVIERIAKTDVEYVRMSREMLEIACTIMQFP